MAKENQFKGMKVEYHILQSFPVSCLNRDDSNMPKTAFVGGVQRARVSSQCWKRQVRSAMKNEFGIKTGKRTKLLSKLIEEACVDEGAGETQAKACGEKIEKIFGKSSSAKEEAGALLFFAPAEIKLIAQKFRGVKFDPDKLITQSDAKAQAKEFADIVGTQKLKTAENLDGLDIALFGRMVAQAAELNVEAAASFSHAISTHQATTQVDFFTALDDLSDDKSAAHMGILEFNSATYYRYISLDLGQLYKTLGGEEFIPAAIEAFTKALYYAVPSARQNSLSGVSPWDYAKVFVRRGQGIQVSFETPVLKGKDGGYLTESITRLKKYLEDKEKDAGKELFGKIVEIDFGEEKHISIPDLISEIQKAAKV
jgi:CRISPR system Cascade subunit CasC